MHAYVWLLNCSTYGLSCKILWCDSCVFPLDQSWSGGYKSRSILLRSIYTTSEMPHWWRWMGKYSCMVYDHTQHSVLGPTNCFFSVGYFTVPLTSQLSHSPTFRCQVDHFNLVINHNTGSRCKKFYVVVIGSFPTELWPAVNLSLVALQN